MKTIITILRITVGTLFIFSGLIKANDPSGLAYKMEEYFSVWNWSALEPASLPLSIGLNILEIVSGLALLLGWAPRFNTRLLMILITGFTFLTGYAVWSGKIKTCGCFGDCIPLQAWQSFAKDLVLLLAIAFLMIFHDWIKPLLPARALHFLLLFGAGMVFWGQVHALQHLPYADCLPYAEGKNLLQQLEPPPGSRPDSIAIIYTYTKNGKSVQFDATQFPDDFTDSTYAFVSRSEKLVRKGNAEPAIKDFALYSGTGTDTTRQLLQAAGYRMFWIAKDFMGEAPEWQELFGKIYSIAKREGVALYMVTNQPEKASQWFNQHHHFSIPVLTCDGTVLKTMLRSATGIVAMNGPVIAKKWSEADMNEAVKWMNAIKSKTQP